MVLTPEMAVQIELSAFDCLDSSFHPALFGSVEHEGFTIAVERMRDILPELHILHQAHWRETEAYRHGLRMNPDYEAMLADEKGGRLIQFTVRRHSSLVGNLRMYVLMSRHTQTLKAVEDTLYLAPQARGGMLAVKLMRFAEDSLRSIGVREIEVNSKLVNKADVLMRRLKYPAVATQFTKVFPENSHVQ